jgi:hypothetical protein
MQPALPEPTSGRRCWIERAQIDDWVCGRKAAPTLHACICSIRCAFRHPTPGIKPPHEHQVMLGCVNTRWCPHCMFHSLCQEATNPRSPFSTAALGDDSSCQYSPPDFRLPNVPHHRPHAALRSFSNEPAVHPEDAQFRTTVRSTIDITHATPIRTVRFENP